MNVKRGKEMLKELLSKSNDKLKEFVKICAALLKGNIYTPYVRKTMEEAKEKEKYYAKGGVVEPLVQRFELDNDEKIIFLGEWKKNNPALNFDFETFARSMEQSAVSVQDLADAMRGLARKAEEKEAERIKRQNTNNWRKMHGLPMRRRPGKRLKQ